MAPDGNNNTLVEELKMSALDWSAKVSLGNPSAKEAWLALYTNITDKLKYPYQVVLFPPQSENQLYIP